MESDPKPTPKTSAKTLEKRRMRRQLHGDELRAKDRQYYLAHGETIRRRKYKLLKERAAKLRQMQSVSPSELALFRQNPVLEEDRSWNDIIVCRLCGWKAKKLSQHLISHHREELSTSTTELTGKAILKEYRRQFGYNERAPLSCLSVRQNFSKKAKLHDSRRRHKGKRSSLSPFRPGHAPTRKALEAGNESGISLQARMRMSKSGAHHSRLGGRKKNALGKIASDWQMAKLRLQGREHFEIARKLDPPLDTTSVRGRLHGIGFPPGKSCVFFRGEPVTEKLLLAHFEDLKFLRNSRQLDFGAEGLTKESTDTTLSALEAASFLNVSKEWVYEHTRDRAKDQIPHSRSSEDNLIFSRNQLQQWVLGRRSGKSRYYSTHEVEKELARRLGVGKHRIYEFLVLPGGPRSPRSGKARQPNYPLSRDLAGRLVGSITSLREEFRRRGATARGGRPKSLLPSEQAELPTKYRALVRELDILLRWAEMESDTITLDRIGDWMCQQSRTGSARMILFWPNLHTLLPGMCERARNRSHGGALGSAERAKEIMCKEYQISRRQLVEAIRETEARPDFAV